MKTHAMKKRAENKSLSSKLFLNCLTAGAASAAGAFLMMLTFGIAHWAFTLSLIVAIFTFGNVGDHRFARVKSSGGLVKIFLIGVAVLLLWAVLQLAHSAFLAFWCFHAVFIAADLLFMPGRPGSVSSIEPFEQALRQANDALTRLENLRPFSR